MYNIKISDNTLKFGDVEVNKKIFHTFDQPITLNLADIDKIVIPDKFKHSDKDFKYFFCYKDDNIIKPLCIVLLQMSEYIKYFDNCGNNMPFLVENGNVMVKCNEIWDEIKKTLGIKSDSKPGFDETYIKAKVITFNGVVNKIF